MLRKESDRKDSVAKKISSRVPQGAWRQGELIGGKPQVVKYLTLSLVSCETVAGH
jgi:hypothetical protein